VLLKTTYVTTGTYHAMLLWAQDLVLGVVLERVEILVALVAVVMLIEVLLVVFHDFLGVEGHIAVPVRTLDASDGLKCGDHLGLVVFLLGLD
jgi:hypothetical protein